jgi:predicted metalloprotease with PDZ domain
VRRQQFREERQTTGRRDAMVEAGMAPDRADYILRRESEMRFESMQAVYEARNSGEPLEFNRNFNADAMLREEIGDTEYEMYLEANNRSTSVGITSVMASSPGERAGLQAGDEIVGYDGERVFSTSELIQQTMAGGDGDVVVDVMRDGSAMQIVLPRGPIGVEIGRFRGR